MQRWKRPILIAGIIVLFVVMGVTTYNFAYDKGYTTGHKSGLGSGYHRGFICASVALGGHEVSATPIVCPHNTLIDGLTPPGGP